MAKKKFRTDHTFYPHFNEEGKWIVDEAEFEKNLSLKQKSAKRILDTVTDDGKKKLTASAIDSTIKDMKNYDELYKLIPAFSGMAFGRLSLRSTETAEWVIGIIGIAGIIAGISSLFYGVFTA